MRKIAIAAALSAALITTGCVQTTGSSAAGVNRSQMMLVSSESVNAQAVTAYDEVISKARAAGKLNNDLKLYNRIQNISKRLIAQAPALRPDSANWDWQVNVIDEDILNAWCMPGGLIAVYSGLVNDLDLTDDEIAVVVGHEICHALREHSREQASQQVITEGAAMVAQLFGVSSAVTDLGKQAVNIGVTLPFSREHETEADELGLELCYRAGFDTDAAVELWTKMMKMSTGSTIELLSTHPSDESRIANLRTLSMHLKGSNLQPVKD